MTEQTAYRVLEATVSCGTKARRVFKKRIGPAQKLNFCILVDPTPASWCGLGRLGADVAGWAWMDAGDRVVQVARDATGNVVAATCDVVDKDTEEMTTMVVTAKLEPIPLTAVTEESLHPQYSMVEG
jgi:hypothetical protein